jgi:hypothetical protein
MAGGANVVCLVLRRNPLLAVNESSDMHVRILDDRNGDIRVLAVELLRKRANLPLKWVERVKALESPGKAVRA